MQKFAEAWPLVAGFALIAFLLWKQKRRKPKAEEWSTSARGDDGEDIHATCNDFGLLGVQDRATAEND